MEEYDISYQVAEYISVNGIKNGADMNIVLDNKVVAVVRAKIEDFNVDYKVLNKPNNNEFTVEDIERKFDSRIKQLELHSNDVERIAELKLVLQWIEDEKTIKRQN